jgi:multiple sugar transport system ATP-binding protein
VAGFIGSPAMNFVPCGLEESAGALRIRLDDDIAFPVPENRTGRYRPHAGRGNLLLGLRPEHIMEQRPTLEPNQRPFEASLDVIEPMGMDTLVHFTVRGTEVCGRVNPNAAPQAGSRARLVADLNHMHLIEDETGKVL